jgi:hypothetical protein
MMDWGWAREGFRFGDFFELSLKRFFDRSRIVGGQCIFGRHLPKSPFGELFGRHNPAKFSDQLLARDAGLDWWEARLPSVGGRLVRGAIAVLVAIGGRVSKRLRCGRRRSFNMVLHCPSRASVRRIEVVLAGNSDQRE